MPENSLSYISELVIHKKPKEISSLVKQKNFCFKQVKPYENTVNSVKNPGWKFHRQEQWYVTPGGCLSYGMSVWSPRVPAV